MKKLTKFKLIPIIGLASYQINASDLNNIESTPIIQITTGKLQGVAVKNMLEFKNIPYAAAPVGKLRWRPPQPAYKWDGVRDASKFGDACIQPIIKGLNSELASTSEDCLKLNVFTPINSGSKKLPVMVWFHGGGLVEGSASEPYYEPSGLIKEGVIVVTVDYRIGKFGFFAPKELVEEAKKNGEPFGNYGIMDQIYSLKWVQKNISAFGGDPNNVTIFGQSAGGRSVTWLMTSPASKGLFHKAIAQSAQQLPLRDLRQEKFGMLSEESLEEKYINSLGVKNLDDLRKLPADKLIVTPQEFQDGEFGGAFIDGKIVIGDPIKLFASGKQHNVPLLIGTNSWDASYFVLGQPKVDDYIKKMGEDKSIVNQLYKSFNAKCSLSAEIMSDGWYRGGVKILANSANKKAPSYAYYFSYLTPNIRDSHIGPAHTFELPYVFGDLENVLPAPNVPEPNRDICENINNAASLMKKQAVWSSYWYPMTDPNNKSDISIANQFAKSWTAFAKTGNPNTNSKNAWQPYSIKTDIMRNFSGENESYIYNLEQDRVEYQIKAINKIYGIE
jgi:para-nitrobenzyl esterase